MDFYIQMIGAFWIVVTRYWLFEYIQYYIHQDNLTFQEQIQPILFGIICIFLLEPLAMALAIAAALKIIPSWNK